MNPFTEVLLFVSPVKIPPAVMIGNMYHVNKTISNTLQYLISVALSMVFIVSMTFFVNGQLKEQRESNAFKEICFGENNLLFVNQ